MGDLSTPYGAAEYDTSNGLYDPNTTNNSRSSRIYTNCDCWRRNGLQDNCQRSMCQGKSASMNSQNGESGYPFKFDTMSMGGGSRRMPNYESDYKQTSDYAPYNAPGCGYQEFQSELSPSMPAAGARYSSSSGYSNGLTQPCNWNGGGNQQGNYPCYM